METRKKFAIMAEVSFWTMIGMTVLFSIINHYGSISVYNILWLPVKISYWLDIIFVPVYLNCVLLFFFFLDPYLNQKYNLSEFDSDVNMTTVLITGTICCAAYLMLSLSEPRTQSIFILLVVLSIGLIAELAVGFIDNWETGFKSTILIGLINGFLFGILTGFLNGIIVVSIFVGIAELGKDFVIFQKWLFRKLVGERG